MCASQWASTNPKGVMKVKANLRSLRDDPHGCGRDGAIPGLLALIARRGAPRAYTLGPERW